MARTWGPKTATPQCFPRPRGDGPARDGTPTHGRGFSPPTRGWPAGISLISLCALRFPRPRGDGPRRRRRRLTCQRFSPPTRGWPAGRNGGFRWRQVFPAHAGMARTGAHLIPPNSCFPRPRGDGPPLRRRAVRGVVFSPPTRGWPESRLRRRTAHWVFPAHAGMARTHWALGSPRCSFPRPRGDGPQPGDFKTSKPRFSPPTRGWPAISALSVRALRVFPAHAGMARGRGLRPHWSQGFPRPRGDGP